MRPEFPPLTPSWINQEVYPARYGAGIRLVGNPRGFCMRRMLPTSDNGGYVQRGASKSTHLDVSKAPALLGAKMAEIPLSSFT